MTEVARQILDDYERLEPGDADSWSPVGSKYQLGYRLNLFFALASALKFSEINVATLQVLDLGCGNGRSTRIYLDMGLEPAQVRGVDFRHGAIERARRSNPAIEWRTTTDGEVTGEPNWVSATTVFSSVTGGASRREIVERIRAGLAPGGHVFYFDMKRANPFAGGDLIDPASLFAEGFDIVWRRNLGRFTCLPLGRKLADSIRRPGRDRAWTVSLRELLSDVIRPANEAVLFRKR